MRPPTLDAPEGEGADDLKLLKGIGPQNERRLNALGIYHVRQIAAWTPDEAAWVGSYLAFPGRIERENWIGQAPALAAGEPPPEPGSRRRGGGEGRIATGGEGCCHPAPLEKPLPLAGKGRGGAVLSLPARRTGMKRWFPPARLLLFPRVFPPPQPSPARGRGAYRIAGRGRIVIGGVRRRPF